MDFISEKKAERRIGRIVLLLCLLPQLLRVILSCIYEYEIAGNHMYPTLVSDVCLYGADILGQFSFFSILGTLIYLSARNGLRGGVETTVLAVGLYVVAYYVQGVVTSTVLSFTILALSVILTVTALVLTAKKCRGAHIIAALVLSVPILGGILQVYASSAVPSLDDILFLVSYAIANLIFELLFILVACRVSKALGEGMKEDVRLTGKLVSVKNPAMLSMLIFDALYVLLSLIEPTAYIIDNLIEYGPPVNYSEWMSIIGVYAEYLIIFVIGYASMRFTAGLIENAYARAEEEQ